MFLKKKKLQPGFFQKGDRTREAHIISASIFFADMPQSTLPRYPQEDPPPYPGEVPSPQEDKQPLQHRECVSHQEDNAMVIILQSCDTCDGDRDSYREEQILDPEQPSTSCYGAMMSSHDRVRDWRTVSRDSSLEFEDVMDISHYQNRYAQELEHSGSTMASLSNCMTGLLIITNSGLHSAYNRKFKLSCYHSTAGLST